MKPKTVRTSADELNLEKRRFAPVGVGVRTYSMESGTGQLVSALDCGVLWRDSSIPPSTPIHGRVYIVA